MLPAQIQSLAVHLSGFSHCSCHKESKHFGMAIALSHCHQMTSLLAAFIVVGASGKINGARGIDLAIKRVVFTNEPILDSVSSPLFGISPPPTGRLN